MLRIKDVLLTVVTSGRYVQLVFEKLPKPSASLYRNITILVSFKALLYLYDIRVVDSSIH